MVRQYPALRLMVGYGTAIAAAVGGGVLLLCLCLATAVGPWVWAAAGLAGGVLTTFLLLVMRDVLRLIADTLIPAP